MHLAINATELGRRRGGNETYLLGLLSGLVAVAPGNGARITLVVAGEGARVVGDNPSFSLFDLVDVGSYRRLPFFLWQQTAVLRQLRPDWYLSTFILPAVTPCRAAVLIHDLSFRSHPDYFPRSIAAYMRLLTGLAVRRADLLVALSRFTQQELEGYYPAASAKTVTIYPGVGDEFRPDGDPIYDQAILAALRIPRPYLLVVGNIHRRKNLGRLLDAWQRLRDRRGATPAMVWVGLDRWGNDQLLDDARAAGVHVAGFVAPDHLPTLYRNAQVLAYPSLYEGFGLPPVEAMACGTPVLTANATALPEAVGEAAVTVDATAVEALTDGLARILFDEALRQDLRTKGLAHAAGLGWDRTARLLLDAIGEERVPRKGVAGMSTGPVS
jgi:glycosyltransferase involved in cell wall biosynthesis